jgi:hypothetical protein
MAILAPAAAAVSTFAAANAPLISAASMLIGAGQAVAGFIGQSQQASQQNAMNARAAEDARRARDYENQQITTRQLQERDAAVDRLIENRVAGLEAASRAMASADSAGVEGNSIDSLANEYFSRAGRADEAITRSANNVLGQLEAERRGSQARYEQRIRSLQPAARPSLIGLGLGIASSVGSGLVGMGRGTAPNTPPAPRNPGVAP